eukprot:TRINITY_DN852_c0_g2_i1.p1 TRINITY_DN852_c0_g2~~TRINITY_DN852_c0_g2_i1.p1  ORF type:complete len:196 (-),score=43.18 TRINITY_DN852_c0_g2_i1:98-637(-)
MQGQPQPGYQQPPQQAVYYQPNYQAVPQGAGEPHHHHHHHHADDEPTCCGNAALAGFCVYFFGIIGALIGLCVERRSLYVVFHAYQSLFWNLLVMLIWIPLRVFISLIALGDIHTADVVGTIFGIFGWIIGITIFLINVLLLIFAIVWARERKLFRLPVIGQLAEKCANSREYETTIYH